MTDSKNLVGPEQRNPVGLLAGSGRFPILFAEKARSLGIPVVCAGIRGSASEQLISTTAHFRWVSIVRMNSVFRLFKREGVTEAVMAGKVEKAHWHRSKWDLLFNIPDLRTTLWYLSRKRKDNNDDTITLDLISEFAKDGIRIVSALDHCPELLVKKSVLTKRRPSAKELDDVEYGWNLAKAMGGVDVGQSVSVRNRSPLAVEAIEGTDKSILRAGEYCRAGGFVVVKVAKPQQDMRFDVPTVGVSTIETMKQSGAKVLAIEADKTIVIDQEETIALADRYGLTVVAVDRAAA